MTSSRIHRAFKSVFPNAWFVRVALLALALRLWGAFYSGVWFDEVFTLKLSSLSLTDISRLIHCDTHPPAYYYYVHFPLRLIRACMGEGSVLPVGLLRLTSILPNLAIALVLAAWAGRRWGRPAAMTALLAAGFAPGMIYYSTELRNYSLAMFFVLLSTLALIELIERPAPKWRWLYFITTAIFLSLHYICAAIYAGQALLHAGIFLVSRFGPKRHGNIDPGPQAASIANPQTKIPHSCLNPKSDIPHSAFRIPHSCLNPQSQIPHSAFRIPHSWLDLLPHLFLAAIVLYMANTMRTKFSAYYTPFNSYRYTAHWTDLLYTFLYDYTAGPVNYDDPTTPYGRWMLAIFGLFYLALGILVFTGWSKSAIRNPQSAIEKSPIRNPQSDRLALLVCAWTMLFFLGGTWLPSVLWPDKIKVYIGSRMAMLTLPLWIIVMLALMQTRVAPRWNAAIRWLWILLMVPCALFSVIERHRYWDDLFELNQRALRITRESHGAVAPIFYLDDTDLYPWLKSTQREAILEPLEKALDPQNFKGGTINIITHAALDIPSLDRNVRSPREARRIAFIRAWTQAHGRPTEVKARLGGYELMPLPPAEYQQFVNEFKKID